ncbi:MAG: sodium-dependent bicarbonate transport family permease [Gemmobacter sp.]
MDGILDLAVTNLTSPMILSFALGLAAALARSDLSVPEAAAKALSLYLLFAIGYKGGVAVAEHGGGGDLALAMAAGVGLSFALPLAAFALLGVLTRLDPTDRAAVAAHYGSISIVTFVTGTAVLESAGIAAEGYMVAVAAAMEAPAIVSALWLATRGGGANGAANRAAGAPDAALWREILLNGSIVLLVGSFLIGVATGPAGMADLSPFVVAPFKGVLCLFLLDMGLVAGRGLRASRGVLSAGLVAFGVLMPLVGAAAGLAAGLGLGLGTGGVALFMVLAASASYIAVPAAMRVALPEANPAIYVTLSLGVTFPFNLAIGIPVYMTMAGLLTGG